MTGYKMQNISVIGDVLLNTSQHDPSYVIIRIGLISDVC